MTTERLEKWKPAALALQEPLDKLPLPFHVASGEAVDVARFFESHWSATRNAAGEVTRPGLELAARENRVYPSLGAEILELQGAFSDAQTEYLLTVSKEPEAPVQRAEFVLSELQAALTFLFDDGVEDDDDARLAVLDEQHRDASSQDALAAALDDYAALAEQQREPLQGLGGFDVARVQEARELAVRLRDQSATKLAGEPASLQKSALDLRNRIATLLFDRIGAVRSATRFVFRNDPDTIRKVTSNYERKRRAKTRRGPGATPDAGAPSGATT